MLKLDRNTIAYYNDKGIKRIKVYFYEAGCSGKKINIEEEFKIDSSLVKLTNDLNFDIYVEKKDIDRFDNTSITRVIKKDHSGKEKVRFIFSSVEIKDRCGCGSSFGFEKKSPKINISNLKKLRNNYKNTKGK